MTTTRRRRWLLAVLAAVVVAAVVAFVVLREDPKDDLPRLVVLGQEQVDGEKRGVFRLDAPKRRSAFLTTMSTVDFSARNERRPVSVGGDTLYVISEYQTPQGKRFVIHPPIAAAAGRSTVFHVLPPPDAVWRLRCWVTVEEKGISSVLWRIKVCWQMKSLTPLRAGYAKLETVRLIESELLTNAAPPTADAPGK